MGAADQTRLDMALDKMVLPPDYMLGFDCMDDEDCGATANIEISPAKALPGPALALQDVNPRPLNSSMRPSPSIFKKILAQEDMEIPTPPPLTKCRSTDSLSTVFDGQDLLASAREFCCENIAEGEKGKRIAKKPKRANTKKPKKAKEPKKENAKKPKKEKVQKELVEATVAYMQLLLLLLLLLLVLLVLVLLLLLLLLPPTTTTTTTTDYYYHYYYY